MLKLGAFLLVLQSVLAQNYKVCIPDTQRGLCNTLDRDGSAVTCEFVESRIDCAIKLARGKADFGVFSEEETILLGQAQPTEGRVVATIRDVTRTEPYAFEAVAIVSNSHTGGFEGLRGARYCHPGFDQTDLRWSPRVLKEFEQNVARLNSCPPSANPPGMTIDELEVGQLSNFFSSACRPGSWSFNTTVDANLKRQYPNLCALCGPTTNTSCESYSINMGVAVAGVSNNNRHIQALECMLRNGDSAVAYVAWQHVREFFTGRHEDENTAYAVLCPDGSTQIISRNLLASTTAPCAFVRQPWSTIVASNANAAALQASLRTWWPSGANPGQNSWQGVLYNGILGEASAVVFFEDGLPTTTNYTTTIRPIPEIDATRSCQAAQRWCTLSSAELAKCNWVRHAAYSLGIQPIITCQQRSNIFECLDDIKENRVDLIASSSNYGYLARQLYSLSPVKLVLNSARTTMRVAAFIKESASQGNVTRFENLRNKKACFPEYGGIAYMSFVRAAQERGVISASECNYARAVSQFFDSACAPGALDASHSIDSSGYNVTNMCTLCKPTLAIVGNYSDFTCSWDDGNRYFGNSGALACLLDPESDVAFLRTNSSDTQTAPHPQASQFRALCRNNVLAPTVGLNVSDDCLLANVVDAEVVTRRNDPLNNALGVLLETLDLFFGYNRNSHSQLINLEIFSPFDGTSDLLFKDSALGFTEPSITSPSVEARNYIDLFRHLESCTGAAPGLATNNVYSIVTMVVMALVTRFIVY